MSSYGVVAAVSEVLRRILWEQFDADPVVRAIVGSESAIVFRNPTETARDAANRLSVWLYQITENEFIKNQPPLHRRETQSAIFPPGETRESAPLALNLFYLLTPFSLTSEADNLLIGKTMQILYDNSTIFVRDQVAELSEELRIIFCRLSLEELTRIWEALKEPYRLSICYEVRVTHIDSLRRTEHVRIVDRYGRFRSDSLQAAGG